MKLEIIHHYDKEDKDCSCDYWSVDVKVGGRLVRHYSDYYHDKGSERAEAFLDGVMFALNLGDNKDDNSPLIIRTNKPDGKV